MKKRELDLQERCILAVIYFIWWGLLRV